ncbi:unnamed protein product [Calypogeia fissa]
MILESGDSMPRPIGTRKVKERLKRAKADELALQLSTKAQLELAAVGRDKVKVMQDNSLMQLLSLPCESIEPELREFFLEWKMEEAKKLRGWMQKYNPQPSGPTQSPVQSPKAEESPVNVPETRWAVPSAQRTPLIISISDDEDGTDTTLETDLNEIPLMDEAVGNYGYGTGHITDLL